MTSAGSSTIEDLREQIAEAVDDGAALRDLERLLSTSPAARGEPGAALWLFGWSALERRRPSHRRPGRLTR